MTGPVKTVSDKKHKVLRKDKSVSSKLLQYFYNSRILKFNNNIIIYISYEIILSLNSIY